MTDQPWPLEGEEFQDIDGRVLRITEVNPRDSRGRQIVGFVMSPNSEEDARAYSTSLLIFHDVWRNKAAHWEGRI